MLVEAGVVWDVSLFGIEPVPVVVVGEGDVDDELSAVSSESRTLSESMVASAAAVPKLESESESESAASLSCTTADSTSAAVPSPLLTEDTPAQATAMAAQLPAPHSTTYPAVLIMVTTVDPGSSWGGQATTKSSLRRCAGRRTDPGDCGLFALVRGRMSKPSGPYPSIP